MQQSIIKLISLSYRQCSTCFGHYNAHHQELVKLSLQPLVSVWNKILRLIVSSSWVFYLSDFSLCRPFSRTVSQFRGDIVRYNVPYIIKPIMHLQMYHQCVNIYHVTFISIDIWLAVHHSITFLLLPSWYTNFLFIHINYINFNSSTCFKRNPLTIRRWTMQIFCMLPLVSSLSASDRLVQPLKKSFISGCTRQSFAESDDTRGCICTICIDLLLMSGLRSKHVEEFNFM